MTARPAQRGGVLTGRALPLWASGYAFNELPAGRVLAGRGAALSAAGGLLVLLLPEHRPAGLSADSPPCRGRKCPGLFPFPSAALPPVADTTGGVLGRDSHLADLEAAGRQSREQSADHIAERFETIAHLRISLEMNAAAVCPGKVARFGFNGALARAVLSATNNGREACACASLRTGHRYP